MEYIINKDKDYSLLDQHSRQDKANYTEVVMEVITEWETRDGNKLVFKDTLDGLINKIKNSIDESGTINEYTVNTTTTLDALTKLTKLGMIIKD